jgi:glutamate/tyrosine decarboxylase-like PLP-dependent enzyme
MDPLLRDAAERASRYLETIGDRSVAPTAAAVARLAELDKLGDAPMDAGLVLRELDEIGSPATLATAGPRFHGFVIGGSLPVALGAHWLATAWDQNAYSRVSSPAAAAIEEIALRWFIDVLHLPPGSGGAFVTGATMANFTALAAARHALLERQGWDVEARGLYGAPVLRVVVGEEAHPSLHKALGMLGLGRERVERVPSDAQGRLRADALPALDASTILCLQAGNVNSGACDPISECVAQAERAGAWVHVDGAFGLWAAASPALRHLVAGLERVDSAAVDAHKWLNVPYDSGIAWTRHPEAMRQAMRVSAAYLPTNDERQPAEFTPELSRRARGVDVWAAMRALGRSGIRELVERNCAQARRYADAFRAEGFEVMNDVVLNQVVVAFGDAARTTRVIDAIQRDGTIWCGPTVWKGRTAMRLSVSSWATTDEDVEKGIAAIVRCARST